MIDKIIKDCNDNNIDLIEFANYLFNLIILESKEKQPELINLYEFWRKSIPINSGIDYIKNLKWDSAGLPGWGRNPYKDTTKSWLQRAKDFAGNIKNNFFNSQPKQNNYDDNQIKVLEKAYQMLQKSGLLYHRDLEKAINDVLQRIKNKTYERVGSKDESNLCFSDWLRIHERNLPRPELSKTEIKKSEISIGDIVELGPETELKGKKINRIGQVIQIRANEIMVKDLTQGKIISVSPDEMHDKEELKGIRLTPSEEKQLSLLGGKKLWVKLTDRQYRKFKARYRVEMKPIVPEDHSDAESSALSGMFGRTDSKEPEKKLQIFEPKKQQTKPLERFLNKRKGII